MEGFEWQEIQIKSENNKESELGGVITEGASDIDDFEEFTDFTNGSGLETFQEAMESHKDDFDEVADFTGSSDLFETSGDFQEHSSNNFEQISKIPIETKLVSLILFIY